MGREIRRVPLGFDWPLNKTWDGFLIPERLHTAPCPACRTGMTAAAEWLDELVHLLLMLPGEVTEHRRPSTSGMHPYFRALMTRPDSPPSAEIVELTGGLAGRAPRLGLFGHDAIDRWAAARKIVEAAGLDPKVWGICANCSGHAGVEAYPGQRADAEAWEPTGPPEGEGWQLWETVSEGSPISPVFPTPEGLARWMSSPEYSWGAVKTDGDRPTYETALRFIADGWAPSFVGSPQTGVVSGVEWIGTHAEGGAA